MAGAIISGMASCGKFKNDYLYGYNRSEAKTLALKEKHGLIPCSSAAEVAEKSEVIVLAVKPQMMQGVLDEIGKLITKEKLVISIAAGKSTEWYAERLAKGVPVVRIMPNINAKVKASVTAVCGGKSATEAHIKIADGIFSSVGKVYHIPATPFVNIFELINLVTAGYGFRDGDSVRSMQRGKTPLLYICGDSDIYVPVDMAMRIFDACTAEKELLLVPGAGHAAAYMLETGKYQNAVTEFIKNHRREN